MQQDDEPGAIEALDRMRRMCAKDFKCRPAKPRCWDAPLGEESASIVNDLLPAAGAQHGGTSHRPQAGDAGIPICKESGGPQQRDDGGLVARQRGEHGGRRRGGRLQHQIAAVDPDADAGLACRLQSLDRAHSRALQRGRPFSDDVGSSGAAEGIGVVGGIEELFALDSS